MSRNTDANRKAASLKIAKDKQKKQQEKKNRQQALKAILQKANQTKSENNPDQ
ncbi:hypothetical protein [Myroides sp. LJL119]